VPIYWEPFTRQQQDEVNRHAANPFYPRVMALKKHPYNLHVTHPTSGHILVNLASLGHYDTNDDGIGIEV